MSAYEWDDDMEVHDSVDDFLRSRGVPDPDGSVQASRMILEDLGLAPNEQLARWGLYSTRRTGEAVERRIAPDTASRPSRARRALLWCLHRDVVLFLAAGLALVLTVNSVWRP